MAAWLGQAQAANLYSDKQSAVDAFRSARDPFLLTSHPLRDIQLVFTNLTFLAERGAFRLFFWWLSSTAGYVPGNEAQLSLSDMAPLRRVLPKGCYPFLSGRSEKISQSFPSKPFGCSDGRHSNYKPLCLCSLPECHHSVRRPFAGLKGRDLRDGQSYT